MVTITQIDPLDRSQDAAFEEWNDVHRASEFVVFGDRASTWTTDELREFYRSPTRDRVALVAREESRAVGAGELNLPLRDNTTVASIWVSVHPAHRRRGVGSALLDELERIAATKRRTVFLATTEFRPGDDDESGEGFARPRGYLPAQTVLRSELALPLPPDAVERLATVRDSGGEYEVEIAVDEMPQLWLEDRAVLQNRMSTDIPLGDLRLEEEDWDDERVQREFEMAMNSGRHVVEAVVRHLPSGHLVGYSNLAVSAGSPHLAYQGDTLVMREHRGHRLGLRLKAATAIMLAERFPDVTAIRTWNAEDNEHMLAVNRELGFVVDGIEREWQKVVG